MRLFSFALYFFNKSVYDCIMNFVNITKDTAKQILKSVNQAKLKAITLIELSIGLIIMGLLLLGALQGWKWIESTRVSTTIQQIMQIQAAVTTYKQTYHKYPDDKFFETIREFGGLKPADSTGDTALSAIGATFKGYKKADATIELDGLKPLEVEHIKSKLDPTDNVSEGWLSVQAEGNDDCLDSGKLKKTKTGRVCKVLILLG